LKQAQITSLTIPTKFFFKKKENQQRPCSVALKRAGWKPIGWAAQPFGRPCAAERLGHKPRQHNNVQTRRPTPFKQIVLTFKPAVTSTHSKNQTALFIHPAIQPSQLF